MKITERHIQAALIRWAFIEKDHRYILPNSRDFFGWEADLISITRAGLVHEYEVKLNIYDYRADAKKWKHRFIGSALKSPSYFWYVTFDFEIDPPDNAGWVLVSRTDTQNGSDSGYRLDVKKKAPRLNRLKLDEKKIEQIARLLSWRLYAGYRKSYLSEKW